MKETLVVNLFGAPGAGKSTTAALVFGKLKLAGVDCELVSDCDKDLAWENRTIEFGDQLSILGKQVKRLNALNGKVDVIITDAPIALSLFYNIEYDTEAFNTIVLECFNKFDNLNYFVLCTKPYDSNDKMQTEEESGRISRELIHKISRELNQVLTEHDIQFCEVGSDSSDTIVKHILGILDDRKIIK